MISWFSRNPVLGWCIAGAYLILVTLTHDLVQRPALIWQRSWGVERVHYIIIAIASVSLVWLLLHLKSTLLAHSNAKKLLWAAGVWILAIIFVFKLVMVRSIESIHIIQYAWLSLMLCALTKSPVPAVLMATLGGVVDEGWQFFWLRPGQPYFDFNDTVINAFGALAGCWLYLLYVPENVVRWWSKQRLSITWSSVLMIVVLQFSFGWVSVYENDSSIAMHRRPPPSEERPVKYVRSNKWDNMSVRLHPYLGIGLTLLIPLGIAALQNPGKDDN